MPAVADFSTKFGMVLKALNLSRGQVSRTVGIDKSVVSRWASGAQAPTDHNLGLLTEAVARHRPGFSRLDWERDVPGFTAALGLDAPAAPARSGPASTPNDKPMVVVLPFANLGGDAEQEYFADGITEDIITALSKWRSFGTIARGTAFTYKDQTVDARQLGRDLGVRYVLEGSVRRAGERVRITARLSETAGAVQVWTGRYDRELVDIFAVQDEISRQIAAVVEPELVQHQQRLSAGMGATNLAAWDCLHRGLFLLYRFTKADIAAARPFFERAIELDPMFSRAYTSLAYTHQLDVLHGYSDDYDQSVREHLQLARKGVALDDSDSYAHLMLAFAYNRLGEPALALAAAEKAVDVNPYDTWALGVLGMTLDLVGEPKRGIALTERAIALTPHDPHVKFYLAVGAQMLFNARDYGRAADWARRSIGRDPSQARAHLLLALALDQMGDGQGARHALAACERAQPGFAGKWRGWRSYLRTEDRGHMLDALRRLGVEVPADSSEG